MEEKNKNTCDEQLSKSKQKRLDRRKKESKKKTDNIIGTVIGVVLAVAVIAVIVWRVVVAVNTAANTLTPSSDYSAQLSDNGFIKGVKTANCIDLADYKNIEIPLSEVEYTDEEVEEDIKSALEANQTLKDDDSWVVQDGNTVNIDYVGTIDGVEFEGGNSNGEGYDLEIGSGSFIDDFEEQLIGHKPGDNVLVEVTFPEDYSSEELAGKDAQFDVTIHGIYVNPEFDDDFVCAYYADYATTADGYRQYLKDTNQEERTTEYVRNYLLENTTVKKYPAKYLKNVKETTMYTDQQSYEYMNQMYLQYYGSAIGSFEDYTGMTDEEYKQNIADESEKVVKYNLIYQAILEAEGVVPTEAELHDSIIEEVGDEEAYNETIETYGKGYQMLRVIENKAMDIAKANVVLK